jgi:site-specific DNA recombinase
MRRADPGKIRSGTRRVRCAIYTRKSSEEGLEQDFNSLDAQREAGEAFIRSQTHEGWVRLPEAYDDGGISGATMERPALRRLMAAIQVGGIDVVVVYKVDRLTRSLADFAKMVEIFDAWGVSFVSVTQQFNTTSSMGRLTLNVLLSFAQFEREVTGERIRDKIAASKKKGMWMGGNPPLGYDASDKKLLVNEAEAETVRHIFRRYAELGSVRLLKEELEAQAILSKARISASGRSWGGNPLARGALYLMLQNRIYLGEIVHKKEHYPGGHAPIVDRDLWERAQARLRANAVERESGGRAKSPSLLAGLLFDDLGNRMTPTHALKKGMRYRYYVSQPLIKEGKGRVPGGRRMPAAEIERLVINRIRLFLSDGAKVLDTIGAQVPEPPEQKRLIDRAAELAMNWPDLTTVRARFIIRALITRIDVQADRVDIQIQPSRVAEILRGDSLDAARAAQSTKDQQPLVLSVLASLKRAGIETRMIIEGVDPYDTTAKPDPSLIKLLTKAHALQEKILLNSGLTLDAIARRERMGGSYFTRLLRLAYLAPDITKAILHGRQPYDLTAAKLLRESRLPLDWPAQRRVLGFA